MYLVAIVIFILSFLNIGQALPKCNGTVSKPQLCSIHDNYNKRTENRGWEDFEFPMTVKSSVTLFDIAEINENKNTVLLTVLTFATQCAKIISKTGLQKVIPVSVNNTNYPMINIEIKLTLKKLKEQFCIQTACKLLLKTFYIYMSTNLWKICRFKFS